MKALVDMFPCSRVPYSGERSRADTIHTPDETVRDVALLHPAYRANRRWSELCCRRASTAFYRHITQIVFPRPYKKVCGVYATPNVAPMTDIQSARDRPDERLIRNAVRASTPPTHIENAVPVFRDRSCPQPATIRGFGIEKLVGQVFLYRQTYALCAAFT